MIAQRYSRRIAALVALGALLGLASPASAAPSLGGRLNLLPKGPYLTTVLGDVVRGTGLGTTLKDVLCPPFIELDELADGTGLQPVTSVLQTGACNLDLLDFYVHTEFVRPNGTVVARDTKALIEIPTLINVDDDPHYELIATIQVLSLDLVTVEINRLPGVTKSLPVSVEAVIKDPSKGSLPRQRIAYGYDAQESSAPSGWRTDLRLTDVLGDPDPLKLGIDVVTSGARGPLAVTAALFNPAVRQRRDIIGARLRFQQPPSNVTTDLELGKRTTATIRSSSRSRLDARAVIGEHDDEQRIDATIDKLPTSVRVGFEQTGADKRRIDYDADAPIDRLDVVYTERHGAPSFARVSTTAEIHVAKLPQGLTVSQTGAQSAKLTTRGGAIGSIDGAFATGTRPIKDPAPGDYVKAVQDAGVTSVAFRILGLQRAEFIGTTPMLLDAVLEPGPFRADVSSPELDAHAEIRDVPHNLRLQLDLDTPRVLYDGNGAGIDELSVAASSPSPFFGRITHIDASVSDVPAVLQLELVQNAKNVELVADNPIGRIELEASSGPGERLPAGQQGAIYRDEIDRQVIFARIFGLRHVAFDTDPLQIAIEAGAGQPFRAEATIEQPGPDLDFSGVIRDLPKKISVAMGPDGSDGTTLVVDNDAPVHEIVVAGHNLPLLDRANEVRAEIHDIPSHLRVDLPAEGPLVRAQASDPIGSMKLQVGAGAFEELPPNRDGAIYVDTPTRFAITAQISGLRGFQVSTNPNIDLLLDLPAEPLPFSYRIERQPFADSELEYFRGEVDRPRGNTHVAVKTSPNIRLDYSADDPISTITLESNVGELGLLTASLANLPRELSVCFDSGAHCKRASSPDSNPIVTVDIDDHDTSEANPLTINAFICLSPTRDVDCQTSPKKFVRVTNLTLRDFAVDAITDGLSTGAFLDTDNRDLTGTLEYVDPGLPVIGGIRVVLAPGFRAQDVRIGLLGGSGVLTCSSGTSFSTIDPAFTVLSC